jgi:hypothetical protein
MMDLTLDTPDVPPLPAKVFIAFPDFAGRDCPLSSSTVRDHALERRFLLF